MISNNAFNNQWINSNGNLDTTNGWKRSGYGDWYYQENGKLVTGKKVIDGIEYEFSPAMRAEQIAWMQNVYYDENGIRTVLTDGWYHLKEYR